MKKTNIAVLILLLTAICAMAVFTACETTQEENSPVEYTVTFDSNGGSAVKAQTVEQGKKVVLPAEPTKDNCDFVGWYTEDNKPYDFDSAVNSSFTLYAKWQEIKPAVTYTVTFDANGGSEVKSQTITEGGKATMPEEPYYEGYDFVGWYTDEDNLYDFNTEVCANITLTAKWQLKSTPIVFNSWNEVFNVFGEENSYLIEDAFNKIFTEKLFNEDNIKLYFGNSMTLADLESGKIEVLKWALEIDDSNNITAVQFLAQRNGMYSDNDYQVRSAKFFLENYIILEDIIGQKKAQYITEDNNILIVGEYSLNLNELDNKLNNNISSTTTTGLFLGDTPTQEQKDLFNLLMPYAVSESTQYSHISVSYKNSTDPLFGTCFSVEISAYDENTNSYVKYQFMLDDNQTSGKTAYERIVDAVEKRDFYYGNLDNKEMISGDIILEMEEEKDIIEITPKA